MASMTLRPSPHLPPPTHRRVLLVIHNPILRAAGGLSLARAMGWNNPDHLATEFCADLQDCSHGHARFEIVERVARDEFPLKVDGFAYSEQGYLDCWRERRGFHQPDGIDYYQLLAALDIPAKIKEGACDEVWLMGFPYAGYYESIMAGPEAFWCNAPPLAKTTDSGRRFVIMGFNYERGVGEMLESFGHRAESILAHVFQHRQGEANLWERFTRYDLTHPGQAEVGNVHFAPNSQRDYDWGNPRRVISRCDDWLHFPDLTGRARQVDCSEWGNGDIRLHHRWWFRHLPHTTGETEGISHNWWEYVLDPERAGSFQ